MKIQRDGNLILTMRETQKKVIQNDIDKNIFEKDMERRIKYILEHKYQQCFARLKKEWEPKLQKRVSSVPTDPDAFAELIFSQPDYKSRSQKEEKAKELEHKKRTGQI